MKLESIGAKAAALVSILAIVGIVSAFINGYHSNFALATEVESLASLVKTQQIAEYEEQIAEAEAEKKRLIRRRALTMNVLEIADIDADIQNEMDRKERILRHMMQLDGSEEVDR